MIIKCPAKINLFLNVLGLDNDSKLHNLYLINQTVSLYDEISVELLDEDIIILESNIDIPLDERNSVYKAAKLIKDKYGVSKGMKFYIDKKIPLEAGLGGESTDAAGTLLLLNKVLNLNISKKELSIIGKMIGSDVPFFIHSGFRKVLSTGEIVKKMEFNNPYHYYIVIKPSFGLSTKTMFDKIDSYPYEEVSPSNLPYNDFMKAVPKEILDIKEYLDSNNINNHTLSGSGSSYYVALENKDEELFKKIKNKYPNYQVLLLRNTDGYKYK